MEIKISKITDKNILNKSLEYSLPADKLKTINCNLTAIYKTEHSPIYTQIFIIELIQIPYFVHVHLRTHKKEFIFESARTFRSDKTSVVQDRNTLTDMIIICNAKKIIDICLKRLCFKTSKETKEVVEGIVNELKEVDKELVQFCVPKCIYRNGFCNEFKSCGYINTQEFDTKLVNYSRNFILTKKRTD